MLRRLWLFGVLPVVGLGASAAWWATALPGAGALHQYAPTAVPAGAPFEIKVLAGTWGVGNAPHGRYRDWSLQLLKNGEPLGVPMAPTNTAREGDRLAVRFVLTAPALADGQPAELTWQLRFVFDKQPKLVAGRHAIAVSR